VSAYGLAIFDQHAAMLAASMITPEHARARGYVSVDTKVRLELLKVTKAGRNVPGLLVPQLRIDGSTWGYQYRPDMPRERDGKPVKYETPVGQRNGIDVPPGVGPRLGDPAVPLWVTEGVKKADAGALAGLCIIALPGVWSRLGRNGHGGKVAVADWHDIALNGRRVVLAFDSDIVRKKSVRIALDQLAAYITGKDAAIEYMHLPDNGDGKTGLDDYLAEHTVDELRALVRPDPPEVVHDTADGYTPPRNTAIPQHPWSDTAHPCAVAPHPGPSRRRSAGPRPRRRGAARPDAVPGAHHAAARQTRVGRRQGPLGVREVLHRGNGHQVLPARGVSGVHRDVGAGVGLFTRAVLAPHAHRVRGGRAA
jgi:hypothetical protein